MPAPRLHKGLWPTVGHLAHTNALTQGVVLTVIFPATLLAYHSAIYPQGMTHKHSLGGRLGRSVRLRKEPSLPPRPYFNVLPCG